MYEKNLYRHSKCANNGWESSNGLNTLCENLKLNEDT